MNSNKKEPRINAAQIIMNIIFFTMKILVILFIMAFFYWLSSFLEVAEKTVMFMGGYLFGQYMLQEWNYIIPKKF